MLHICGVRFLFVWRHIVFLFECFNFYIIAMNFAKKVLTVGVYCKEPRGGIAQLLYNYQKFVYNPFYFVPNGRGERTFLSYFLFVFHPLRMIFQFIVHPSIRIVHIHTPSYKGFFYATMTAKIARLFGKKVVMHMHGGGFREYYSTHVSFVKRELGKVDGIVALSDSWGRFYTEDVGIDNVHVIPNVIPLLSGNSQRERKEHGVFNLLFLGFVYKEKGVFDLVNLLKSHHAYYSGRVHLYIAGGKYEEDRLVNEIEEFHLHDVVTFLGWVTGEKKEALFDLADAYVLPSYKEGLPMSILEAMSHGLPILATNVGGIPELVENGVNGFLFSPGDIVAIQESIDILLTNRNIQKHMGEMSRCRAESYGVDSVQKKLSCLYASVL